MAEYIDIDKAIVVIDTRGRERETTARHILDFNKGTYEAADVQPIRHGEWFISIGKDGKLVGTICPICGFAWSEAIDAVKLEPCLSLIKTNYCPNCGAKMDAEASDDV